MQESMSLIMESSEARPRMTRSSLGLGALTELKQKLSGDLCAVGVSFVCYPGYLAPHRLCKTGARRVHRLVLR